MDAPTECTQGYGNLNTFLSQLSTYLSTGGTPPALSLLDGNLPYDNLLTFTVNSATENPQYSVGFSIETISDFSAVQREIAMAVMTKVELLDQASSSVGDDAQYYADTSAFNLGVLQGAPTNGSRS